VSENRAKTIFLRALELTSDHERAALLETECQGDADLRRQVEVLWRAELAKDSFLEKPAAALHQPIDSVPSRTSGAEQPGTRIGPYKLLEPIGEGGMGTVWMAEQQEPVRRIVALKLIKAGMDTKAVLARFDAERQALALMDHPNIAKVLDAGAAPDGRPYFVMELVKGTPLTTFCDANKLSTRKRLELFVATCQAIQHAHQKGVIHRDIKPTNVLVALYDDRPVPKVIDFGVAKAAGQPLTEKTLHTGFGSIIGTPEYMSPEQATFNQLDIDTRSDVYSLGVLLYELLTGTTPVDKTRFKEAALLEVLRVVREEDPPRPSVKLSTTQARAGITATHGAEPARLAKEMRGELDWIVMKSLEKNRNRRYETAAALGRDVDRYLKDEIVEARPPSAWYLTKRFVDRNFEKLFPAFLAFCLFGGWFGSMIYNARQRDVLLEQTIRAQSRAEDQADIAKQAAAETTSILSFFTMTVINPAMDSLMKQGDFSTISLKDALLQAEKRVGMSFKDKPLLEARVRQLLGSGLTTLGDSQAGQAQLEKALALFKKNLGPTHQDTVSVMLILSTAYQANDQIQRAIEILEEALRIRKAEGAKLPAELQLTLAPHHDRLAELYLQAKRHDDAIRLMREAVARDRQPDGFDLTSSLHSLGKALMESGRSREAEPVLRECLTQYERPSKFGQDWFRFVVESDLGNCLLEQKKFAEAEPYLTRSFDELKKREGNDLSKGPILEPDGWVDLAGERLAKLLEMTARPEVAARVRQELAKRHKAKS